jgi:peptidoglycan-N-acetylglucosamine deacetylase
MLAAAFLLMLVTGCSAGTSKAEHLSFGCREGRHIALTFDDGPNPPYTEQILEVLRSHDAVATFFDEGQAAVSHPDVVKRELALGMVVGSHSYLHSTDLPSMSRADFGRDLRQAEAALTPVLGYAPGLYRAPYGHTSDNMLAELRAAGYTSIGWDLDSTDWSDASADQVVRGVLDNAHPGAIVLMHDGGLGGGNPDRSTTLAALPRIIDGLREQGYTLVTVPDLTGAAAEHGGKRRPACSVR